MLPETSFIIHKTSLPILTKGTFDERIEEYENVSFEGEVLSSINKKISFENCYFKNVIFENCNLSSSSFVNVLFENCDLSNISFEQSTIHRVTFVNSKLIGGSFCTSSILDTVFTDSYLSYANFSGAKVKNSAFLKNKMDESYFYDVKFCKTIFDDCLLSRAEFIDTKLKGMDFSTCFMEGIRTDLSSIAGMITSERGALELSSLLNIQIRRDYENN